MKKKVVIFGGGVGGLSAGWMLSRTGRFDVTVIEKESVLGGMCGTFSHEDMLLDYGPHKCFSTLPGVLDEIKTLMGNELLTHEKKNRIYLFGKYLNYPLQFSELALQMRFRNIFHCGLDFLKILLKNTASRQKNSLSFEEYCLHHFGRTIYDLVFRPLAEKTWGSPESLSADIAKARIPSQNVLELMTRIVRLKKENVLTDATYFYYPKMGFGRIPLRMGEEITKHGGQIFTQATPLKIYLEKNRIKEVTINRPSGTITLPVDYLISTLPFDVALELMSHEKDKTTGELLALSKRLQYRAVFLVYIGLMKKQVTKDHWIFFPGREFLFGRVFEQKNMSIDMIPQDKTLLCCDFTGEYGGELWNRSDTELSHLCINGLERCGLIDKGDVLFSFVKRFPKFYPRYDMHYKEITSSLYRELKKNSNFISTGRIGFYNYNNSDHCVDMGRFIANGLTDGLAVEAIWEGLESRVQNYRIVD